MNKARLLEDLSGLQYNIKQTEKTSELYFKDYKKEIVGNVRGKLDGPRTNSDLDRQFSEFGSRANGKKTDLDDDDLRKELGVKYDEFLYFSNF